jgi:hypothetical protein
MSVTFKSLVAVGVKLDSIFKKTSISKEVTKFDPDTGKSYQKIISEPQHLLCGKPIELKETEPEEWVYDLLGLDLSCDCSEDGTYIVGKILSKLYPPGCGYNEESIAKIDLAKVEEVKKQVKEKLAKFGYAGDVDLYVISYVSY